MKIHPKLANMKIYLAYNNDDDKNANGDGGDAAHHPNHDIIYTARLPR